MQSGEGTVGRAVLVLVLVFLVVVFLRSTKHAFLSFSVCLTTAAPVFTDQTKTKKRDFIF